MIESIVPQPGKKATARDKSRPPFAPVPKSLMSRKDVSQSAKLLYGLILSLSCETGHCYAGDEFLAEGIGVSRRQVQRALCELEALRCLTIRGATNTRRLYPLYEKEIVSKAHKADRIVSEPTQAAPEHTPLMTGDAPELAPSAPPTCDENGADKRFLKEKKKKEETTAAPPQRERTQPKQPPPQSFSSPTVQERKPLTPEYIRSSRAVLPPAMREALERKDAQKGAAK